MRARGKGQAVGRSLMEVSDRKIAFKDLSITESHTRTCTHTLFWSTKKAILT